MRKLAIIGAGAYGQQIATFAKYDAIEKYDIAGFIDDFEDRDKDVMGLPVLGSVSDIFDLYISGVFECVFIAIGYHHMDFKENLYKSLKGKIPLANIICRTAFIHPTVKLGEGVFIENFAIISQRSIIEDNVSITLNSIVNHDNIIKSHTFISTRVTTAGNVIIGQKCFIGVGSIISDGVTITDKVWLSPSSIVVRDITTSGHYMSPTLRLLPIPNK